MPMYVPNGNPPPNPLQPPNFPQNHNHRHLQYNFYNRPLHQAQPPHNPQGLPQGLAPPIYNPPNREPPHVENQPTHMIDYTPPVTILRDSVEVTPISRPVNPRKTLFDSENV